MTAGEEADGERAVGLGISEQDILFAKNMFRKPRRSGLST